MKKITLYELLTKYELVTKFKLSEKLKINVITSTSNKNRVIADIEEFYLSEVPLRLLSSRVINIDYDENWIEIRKWSERMEKKIILPTKRELTKGELILISWLAIGFVYETVKELMEMLDFEEEEGEKKEKE